MALFLFVALLVVAWLWWWRGQGGFTEGFARLLRNPVGARTGLGAFVTGREQVGGEFGGRPVVLLVRRRRSRYQLGTLTVAMRPSGPASGIEGDAAYLWDLVRDPDGREALSRLEKVHGLRLVFEDGWLKATWAPVGLMLDFPGRCDEERWRTVLELMARASSSVETRAISA